MMNRLAIACGINLVILIALLLMLMSHAPGRPGPDPIFLMPLLVPDLDEGGGDCWRLPDGDVTVVPGGYFIGSIGTFVHEKDKSISGDHDYWLCSNLRAGTSFYVPPDPAEDQPE